MTWAAQLARIRRYLRDPNGNIWAAALLLNLYNDEQAYIASKVAIDQNVQVIRIPVKFQSGYMHDFEYTHSGFATRRVHKFGYYDDANDKVYLHKWEAEYLEGISSPSTSCAGYTYTHPWEAFVSGVTPSEPPAFPLPANFHSIIDIYWDRKPLVPSTRQEIEDMDSSWRTHGGYPTHYFRHDELEDWIYLWPRPSIGASNWQDDFKGEDDPDEAEYPATPELVTNGSFESSDPPNGWTAYNDADLDRHADPNTGSYCLEINEGGSNYPWAYQDITVSELKEYEFSFYVKAGTSTTYRVYVNDLVGGKNLLDTESSTATTSFVKHTYAFTTPSGCTSVRIYLLNNVLADAGTSMLFDDISLKLSRLDIDNNLLVIFKKEPADLVETTDASALPSFLTKYVEYGVIAKGYKANTDGRIESLAEYWEWRKEIGLKILATYKSKRSSARHYRLRTSGLPGRMERRHPQLPDTAITPS